ncbi:MAG: sugar isomerase [Bacteroidetes bacterium]|nr:sugar isomerase [Bacteroidota bacterium]
MKPDQAPYLNYNLIRDMFETIPMIRSFNTTRHKPWLGRIRETSRIFVTGEGSSRIFPANNLIHHAISSAFPVPIFTEGATQLLQYPLTGSVLIGASNSGRTKELIRLFSNKTDCTKLGLTFHPGTPLADVSDQILVIGGAEETSIPATKSVVAQALTYDLVLADLAGYPFDLNQLADFFKTVLATPLSPEIRKILAEADHLYFSGFNTGVSEELRLKTNEICHKKSDYLPGTYLLHGIEEVITPRDAVILMDVPSADAAGIITHYSQAIGVPVIAVSSQPQPFLTFPVPEVPFLYQTYIQLAAGWNLLAEAGIGAGVNIDKPERVRKIGNEIEFNPI